MLPLEMFEGPGMGVADQLDSCCWVSKSWGWADGLDTDVKLTLFRPWNHGILCKEHSKSYGERRGSPSSASVCVRQQPGTRERESQRQANQSGKVDEGK